MALKLTLKPGEQFIVNGAVVVNGDRRATIIMQNRVALLRERDIMHAEQATTPARRIYFAAMCAYIDPANADEHYLRFTDYMRGFLDAIEAPEIRMLCVAMSKDMMDGNHYRALTHARALIDYETCLLGDAVDVDQRLCADPA